ncbi:hypothetical protein CI238_13638 [Colletotrichum incanum]|uniref:Uncharacterized protein n=1 Tax=Colletotrichum incanum TaxID=1573173 RepID=A0A161VYW1_COLIC|nr:hypothetical protein CI238_13638 [Colletotrichum incanum]
MAVNLPSAESYMRRDRITETLQRITRDLPTKTHCFTAVAEDAKPQYTSTSASVAVRPPRGISADQG